MDPETVLGWIQKLYGGGGGGGGGDDDDDDKDRGVDKRLASKGLKRNVVEATKPFEPLKGGRTRREMDTYCWTECGVAAL
eukprot:12401393-Karenia_brevis.AAC.1